MNRIKDIINEYDIEAYLQDGERMDRQLTEEEKERILNRTLKKIRMDEKRNVGEKRMKKVLRISKIAAIVAIALFMSGMVIASVKEDGFFEQFLNAENSKVKNKINNMSTEIGKEETVNGYTVKLRECLNDDNAIYMLFDIMAPKGVQLNELQYAFAQERIVVEGGGSMGYYPTMIEDEDKSDNKISIMYAMDNHYGVVGKKITVILRDFSYYGKEAERVTQANGKWEFVFTLKKNTESKQIIQLKKLKIGERTYWVTIMRISPISASIDLSRSITNLWKSGYLNTSDLLENMEITLNNGKTVQIVSKGVGTKGIGYFAHFSFDRAIDLEEIDKIEYKGITLRYK
ncbi:MAG: DUF4179 domain-containing protein [Velocimicrobium sp.]